MIRRIRVIGLVGAGAISSAAICSIYLAYTLDDGANAATIALDEIVAEGGSEEVMAVPDEVDGSPQATGDGQAFLVAFLADADPQVRTLAAWGLVTGEEADDRQREILEFVRKERDPEVRAALYRFLHGQRSIGPSTLIELVKQEEDHETWLAGCDLLADAVHVGTNAQVVEYFHLTVVPALKQSAVDGKDLHCKIAAIIALRRAGTDVAVEALKEIIRTSRDEQVVLTASSAISLTLAADQ